MSRIQALSIEQAAASAQPSLRAVEKAVGFLPNAFRTLANSPAALGGYLQLKQALSKGELSPAEGEWLALAVSQVNECEYCLASHTYFAGKAGLSEDAIRAARDGEGNMVAAFASKLARQRGKLDDADIKAAREAGLSDGKIVEIVANVVLLTYTNLLNNLAQTEVDFPPVAV
ncbi:MAG TPA: carboxymuconolactone decarboxylase family protein [Paraburkholderia sp.]|jgi:uncharacterized peroxidase-related enzyme